MGEHVHDESGELARYHIIQGIAGHIKDLRFYPKDNKKLLKSLKQETDIFRFAILNNHCYVDNRLKWEECMCGQQIKGKRSIVT